MTEIFDLNTNPKQPGAYSGLSGFIKNNKNLDKIKVKKELLKTNVFTQHELPTRKFKRRKVIIGRIDELWQADLIDVQKLKFQNSHF